MQKGSRPEFIGLGAAGSGKSYLACALGMEACKQSYSVKFMHMAELLEVLLLAKAAGTLAKYYKEYTKYNLLIIDDWMLTKLKPEEAILFVGDYPSSTQKKSRRSFARSLRRRDGTKEFLKKRWPMPYLIVWSTTPTPLRSKVHRQQPR